MRARTWSGVLVCLMVVFGMSAQEGGKQMSAQEKAMMEAWQKSMTPGAAHKQLDGMVGTWDTKVTSWMAPGAPPSVSTGVSENRWVLGGRFIEQRFTGTFMNQKFEGIGYTGYDNTAKHYVGTWMDNMSTAAMVSTGSASADGKSYEFTSQMDDPMTGKPATIKEKIMIVDKDTHVMEMWAPGPDGKMYKSMEIRYTRKKA